MRRLRISPGTYRALALLALLAVAIIIVTGAAVRLTGSGLGCSDWPNCEEGSLVAPLEFHPMVEFVNRLFTGLVSVAIVVAVLGSLGRDPRRRDLVWLSLGLVAGLVGQVVLGGLTVIFELKPPFVMGHFLLSILLLGDAIVLYQRAGIPDRPEMAARSAVCRPVRAEATLAYVLTCVALFTGTIVTAAGPHGGDEDAQRLSWPLPNVARVHGASVIALVVSVVVLLILANRLNAPARFRNTVVALLVALAAQGAIGYVQYFNGVPALLVGLHVTGAVIVFTIATFMLLNMYEWVADTVPVGDPATPVFA